jgi:hypothetical protein
VAKGKTKISKPVSLAQATQKRYYPRWSKIVSQMSPASLAKMREGSSTTKKQGQTTLTIRTSNTVGDPWLAPRFSNPFAGKYVLSLTLYQINGILDSIEGK